MNNENKTVKYNIIAFYYKLLPIINNVMPIDGILNCKRSLPVRRWREEHCTYLRGQANATGEEEEKISNKWRTGSRSHSYTTLLHSTQR